MPHVFPIRISLTLIALVATSIGTADLAHGATPRGSKITTTTTSPRATTKPNAPPPHAKKTRPLNPERYEWGLLPALTFDTDIGFGFGAIVTLARFSKGYYPYLWRLEVLGLMTVKGKPSGEGFEFPFHNDYIKLDLPGLLSGHLRLNARIGFSRFSTSGYFGFGNAAKVNVAAREKNSRYHMVDRIYPLANLRARIRVAPHLEALVGGQVIYNWLNPYSGSLFERDLASPDPETRSLLRGTGRYAVFEGIVGWIYDTRDHEYLPTHGMFHEISWRFSPGWAIGTDHGYGGINLTLRAYHALLGSYLILAGRIMADLLVGDPPYYTLAQHGGLFDDDSLGGARAIRGIPQQRHLGKIKLFGNLELRSRFLPFTLGGQRFQLGALVFFDAGRTWADWRDPENLDGDGLGLKFGTGAGLRLAWGETFIIRADVAYSPDAEPIGVYIDINHIF